MKHTVEECTVVLRQLSGEWGVDEESVSVGSLEELYDYCLKLKEPRLLERLVLAGRDERGRGRSLTFTFRSITERKKTEAPDESEGRG